MKILKEHNFEYATCGAPGGQWITLSHPVGSDLRIWDAHIAELSQQYRVLVYNLRGHGGDVRDESTCNVRDLADDVIRLWDYLGIARSHFVGLSLGGCVGVALASNAPTRVSTLTVVNSRLEMDELASIGWSQRAELAESEGMRPLVNPMIERWLTPAFVATHPVEVGVVKQTLLATSPNGFAACARALADMRLKQALAGLSVPTLFLAGLSDNAVPSDLTRHYADQNPAFSFAAIPGPHILNLENPEGFNQAVLGFLTNT
jgi:3-oxoadipate enol-lactonase